MTNESMQRLPKGRHLPLLVSLVILFPVYPVMVELGWVRFYRLVFLAVMVVATYAIRGRRRRDLIIALVLGTPAAVAQGLALGYPSRQTLLAATLLSLVFLAYVTLCVFSSVLERGKVTSDKLAGAISVYLLLGLVWALLNGVVAVLMPGAFEGVAVVENGGEGVEYALIYYSFVTLTTLGYGDISPAIPMSQSLAWIEAVTGQLYLAILIARLVGLHVVHAEDSEE